MIIKTTGIVIRLDPFSKTSQIITWITPDHGRIVTLAKGAKRRQSLLLGQFDLFQGCELLFYASERSSLHILKECSPLKLREPLRTNWRACIAASYLCDMLNHLTPTGAAQTGLYLYADAALDFLSEYGASPAIVHWYEIRLLHLLGVAPQFGACLGCGVRNVSAFASVSVSFQKGGLLCPRCRSEGAGGTILDLTQDALSMLRIWQSSPSPLLAKRTTCTSRQSEMVEQVLGRFLDYHLETSPISRSIAMEML
jgi:DNA repair protein RecO (recombination protein O)